LSALLDLLPLGVAHLDGELRIREANVALAGLLGCPDAALVGQGLAALWPALAEEAGRALAAGAPAELRAAPPGNARALRVRLRPLPLPDTGAPGLGLVVEELPPSEAEADRLRALLSSAPVGVAAFDRELRYVFANPALGAINGRAAEEHVGRALGEMIPGLAPVVEPLLRRVLETGEASPERLIRDLTPANAGAVRALGSTYFPVRGLDGAVAGVGALVIDRSQEARAEAALHGLEQTLAQVIEHAPAGIAVFDASMRYLAVSRRYLADFRLGEQSLIGRSHFDVFPELPEEKRAVFGRCLAGEVEPYAELPLRRVDGAVDWVRRAIFPWYEREGEIGGVIFMGEVVTAQRRAEEALAQEHRQRAAILATLHEAVVAFRADGRLVMANAAALRLAEVDQVESLAALIDPSPATALVPVDAEGQPLPRELRALGRVLRGESFTGLEQRLKDLRRGETRWFSHHGTPVYDAEGKLTLAVLSLDDITERKRAEAMRVARAEELSRTNAELDTALRLKDEFLAMISHELRTPLNAVLGLTDALREEVYGPVNERQRLALTHVGEAGAHLLAVLTDILDLAHLGAGAAKLDRRSLPVRHLVQAALRMVEMSARSKGLRLTSAVEDGVERLVGDERRLVQILANLLQNAVKFTPAGGTVALEVSADRARDLIRFAVRDDGIGIAEPDCARLFKPFTQVDGRLSRTHGGIGLGLTLVRRLVDLHHGGIEVESEPGAGSRFTVSLPWSRGDEETPEPEELPLPPAPWATPLRVVFADDHELTLAADVEVLTRLGCEVVAARTGEEAVAQVHATRPDVVVMDVQMPGMNELAALRRLRAEPAWARLPILALSAQVLPGDRRRCLAAGATRFLAKPLTFRALVEAIAEVLA
jgi:PAS domain S-box-containing protein